MRRDVAAFRLVLSGGGPPEEPGSFLERFPPWIAVVIGLLFMLGVLAAGVLCQ